MISPGPPSIVSVHPAVATRPPRTSTDTSTFPGQCPSASPSSVSIGEGCCPEDHALYADREYVLDRGERAQATAELDRHPELFDDPTDVVEVRGAPAFAPSRSTTCRRLAPACTHSLAADSGSSS